MSEPFEGAPKSRRNSTTWKPGQCGNPRRIGPKLPKTLEQLVDECFAEEVPAPEGHRPRRMSTYERIVTVLQLKAPTDPRARAVLRQYRRQAIAEGGGRQYLIELGPDDGSLRPLTREELREKGL